MFLDVGTFALMADGCSLVMWIIALACGKTVPMLVSASDDNWYCSSLLTSDFCWVSSWTGAEIWVI